MPPQLTITVITKNEAQNIADCLESVRWADEIIVVDSGSTDRTEEIARRYTHHFYFQPFVDFAAQKNNALTHASGDWVFVLDADERVTPLLAAEIQQVIGSSNEAAYQVKRKTTLFGKELNYSGTQNDFQTRLFPRGKAHYEQPVHEKLVTALPVKPLCHSLLHLSTANLKQYQAKLDQYLPFEMALLKQAKRKIFLFDVLLRPPLKFISLYIVKLGFLDGIAGFKVAWLAAFYDFMKFFKGWQATRGAQ